MVARSNIIALVLRFRNVSFGPRVCCVARPYIFIGMRALIEQTTLLIIDNFRIAITAWLLFRWRAQCALFLPFCPSFSSSVLSIPLVRDMKIMRSTSTSVSITFKVTFPIVCCRLLLHFARVMSAGKIAVGSIFYEGCAEKVYRSIQ